MFDNTTNLNLKLLCSKLNRYIFGLFLCLSILVSTLHYSYQNSESARQERQIISTSVCINCIYIYAIPTTSIQLRNYFSNEFYELIIKVTPRQSTKNASKQATHPMIVSISFFWSYRQVCATIVHLRNPRSVNRFGARIDSAPNFTNKQSHSTQTRIKTSDISKHTKILL